jgi:hypothetical protein
MPIQDAFHGVLFLALRFAFQPLPQRRGAIFIGHRVQDEGYDPHPCVPRRSRGRGIPYGLRFTISRMPSLLPGASTSKAIPSRLLGFMLLHLI